MCKDTIYISLFTYEDSMELELKTKGGDNAVKYWRRYLSKNKFILTLTTGENMPQNDTLDIETSENLVVCNLTVNVEFTEKLVTKWAYLRENHQLWTTNLTVPAISYFMWDVTCQSRYGSWVFSTDSRKSFNFILHPGNYMVGIDMQLSLTEITFGKGYVNGNPDYTIAIVILTPENPNATVNITVDWIED